MGCFDLFKPKLNDKLFARYVNEKRGYKFTYEYDEVYDDTLENCLRKEDKDIAAAKLDCDDELDYLGNTPLLQAINDNNVEKVFQQIGKNTDIHAINELGHNAFTLACTHRMYTIAKLLYERGVAASTDIRKTFCIDIVREYPHTNEEIRAFFYICKLLYEKTYISILPTDILSIIIHLLNPIEILTSTVGYYDSYCDENLLALGRCGVDDSEIEN
jgi:ankyrin repeat protein